MWPFLLMYGSYDMRHTSFRRLMVVNGTPEKLDVIERDEEWKEEIERRETTLMRRLNSKINTFYNEQLKRDEDVLTFLEKREGRKEASML